jgi:RNA recognition motif-containing protein
MLHVTCYNRGIAFITFETQEGADAALACNGEQLEGQTLKVMLYLCLLGFDRLAGSTQQVVLRACRCWPPLLQLVYQKQV